MTPPIGASLTAMKRLLAVLLFVLVATPVAVPVAVEVAVAAPAPSLAQAPNSGDDPAIHAEAFRAVISGQMEAFARDDGAAALAFAAPSIQRLFGTPERFMAMVRGGFQPVYRPRTVAFEAPIRVPARGGLDSGGAFAQPVRVTGPDGRPVLAMYHMEQQPDGSWRIAGVVLRALAEREG